MSRSVRIYIGLTLLIALSVLFLFSVIHTAAGAPRAPSRTASAGHRLAQAWCQTCHAVEPQMTGLFDEAPSFQAIADRRGTTMLSLKVFWRTSHQNMPNLVISPDQADALANYILSLRDREN
ncbi:cytochrome c [Bradyrhizobium diazoefficiens]|nr:c-type cytochrome [Bradyrhizobium diazoefficiens]MBR0775987.1 cytochrome c [Bradyrhizobium diazoefficiens]MBR0849850.1 cytochrome c [Bradyrhizobium diazoefficiens]